MRLIDADLMALQESEAYMSAQTKVKDAATKLVNEVVHKKIQVLLADAPTVDAVSVKHGRWLTWEEQFPSSVSRKKNGLGVFCDCCHGHSDNMTDYCPNCGARMDLEDSEKGTL